MSVEETTRDTTSWFIALAVALAGGYGCRQVQVRPRNVKGRDPSICV